MIDELKKHLKDKDWRVENLYYIIDKKGNKLKFKKNETQILFCSNAWNKNIILKARQEGITTYECIDSLDDVLFNNRFNAGIIAQDQETQISIFKKILFAWENIKPSLKEYMGWELKTDRTNELSFAHNSTIRVALSFRGDTLNRLHISEFGKICAKYPLKAEEIITGAFPSVVPGGRIDIESTAEGDWGKFYEMYQQYDGLEPQNYIEFKTHFFPWYFHKEYSMEGEYDLPDKYIEMQSKYNLSREQVNWYYFTEQEQKKKMAQEYPTTAEEAFLSSGTKFFDMDIMPYQIMFVKKGTEVGDWIYYDDYKPNHIYALGADIALGVGQDSSTCVIFDFTVNKVVATYKNNNIKPDVFAYEIKNGAVKYGECLVAPEKNSHGEATIAILKGIYNNIYTEVKVDKHTDTRTDRLGWHTNLATKPRMMSQLKSALDDDAIKVVSKPILDEIKTYDANDLNVQSFDPEATQHWDLLIALAIAFQMKTEVFVGEVKAHTIQNNSDNMFAKV